MHRRRYVCVLALTLTARSVAAQTMTLDRGGATAVVEPYAPNVVRVSVSLPQALGGEQARLWHHRQAGRSRLDARRYFLGR